MIEAIVETAVLFDHSASSRLTMTGKDRQDLLHRLSTNDILLLKRGHALPSLLLERNGRLVDRLLVVDRGDDFLLLGSPGRGTIVRDWIQKFTIMEDSKVSDVSEETSEYLLVGPMAPQLLAAAFDEAVSDLGRFQSIVVDGMSKATTIVRVEDHEGPSYVLVSARGSAASILGKLGPVANATAEMLAMLRIKAGLPTWGSEYDERTLPLEARLVDAISFTKGCYTGQEIIARVHHRDRLKRLLCRLEIEGEEAPPSDADLFHDGKKIGWITAAAPGLNRCFALGYVDTGFDLPGTNLAIGNGDRRRTAKVLTFNSEGDPRWPA
jgi:folate-binding protein YgfZ